MEGFRIFLVDKRLNDIQLTDNNIPIFKQGGMITEFKDVEFHSIEISE